MSKFIEFDGSFINIDYVMSISKGVMDDKGDENKFVICLEMKKEKFFEFFSSDGEKEKRFNEIIEYLTK